MSKAKMKIFFLRVARIVLYPVHFALRLLGRTLLLLAMVLAVLWPVGTLFTLLLWLRDLDLTLMFEEYYSQLAQAGAFLMGAGLFGWFLKLIGKSALDAFLSLVRQIRKDLGGHWIAGREIVKSLVRTWRDNFAKIPSSMWRTGKEAFHLASLLGLGTVLLIVTAPLFEREPKMVDRYIFVAGTEDAGSLKKPPGNGGGNGKPPGNIGSKPENGTTGGTSECKNEDLKENLIGHMRAGAVFSLTHHQNGQPTSGKGICLEKSHREWLCAFWDAIADCVKLEQERGVSRGATPTFEVTAFASTAPAKVGDTVDPKVNCEIANRRAHAVGAFLAGAEIADERRWTCEGVKNDFQEAQSLCDGDEPIPYPEGDGGNGFRVQINQWADAAQMEGGKPADDGALPDQRRYRVEMFNRSVHITVPQDFCRVPES